MTEDHREDRGLKAATLAPAGFHSDQFSSKDLPRGPAVLSSGLGELSLVSLI